MGFFVVVLKSLKMCTFDLLSRTNKIQQPNGDGGLNLCPHEYL